jgi:hypothetical protein
MPLEVGNAWLRRFRFSAEGRFGTWIVTNGNANRPS